ncbi:MAG TPA: XrtA/PEP-CTERM system-associated ATPase [Vicinamibacterales bacterium]|nr:XrtA/PEP-CTERM system-associated ATPase [Vicinamibacterales bacterium]
MYERFYELRERPFALSPDPDYLYPSRVHREALDYLRYGLESQAGFVVITGEIGSGKTTLLQALLRSLDSQTTVGRIVNTLLDPRELIETIMVDFGLEPAGRTKPLMLRDLAQYLVDQRMAGRLVLLVIDEAQNLSPAALEELRMLSNLETEKSKLLQIVLIGQPNLREQLAAPELEQLRQRVTVSYHLQPLDQEETANYINHRLRRAALGAPLEFPREATDLVHVRSRGVPRVINVICDAALVFGYAEERRHVDRGLIQEVLKELESTGVLAPADGVRADSPTPAMAAVRPEPAAALASATRGTVPSWQPSPVPAALSDDRRAALLDQREEAIRQRERELAEQRRVLAEEYRLLRARRAPAAPAPVSTDPRGTVRHVRVRLGEPAARFEPARPEGAWAWIKRVMLGGSEPAVEKN